MSIKSKKNICLILSLFAYIFIYLFFLLDKVLKYSEVITASYLLFVLFISLIFFGYQKDKKNFLKKKILLIVLISLILYFFIIYGLGFIVGFLKNSYSLEFFSIINNVFLPIIIIICIEFIRYIVISVNKEHKFIIVIYTCLFIAIELMMTSKIYDISKMYEIFRMFTISILPVTVKHFVLSYLTYNVGYKSSLLYRLFMDLYLFVMPLLPDLGDYLSSIIGVVLPFLVFVYASRAINEFNNGVEPDFIKTTFNLWDIPYYIFFIILIALISGYFKYYILGVASASMEPKINVGDAVFVTKVSKDSKIEVGDIIVYEAYDRKIVHRVSRIREKNGEKMYYTKGDNNSSEDSGYLLFEEIKGKVIFRIPYIALPSVYLSEIFGKE